jgi:hypothetical protein
VDYLEDRGIDGRIILNWILGKWDRVVKVIINRMNRARLLNATQFILIELMSSNPMYQRFILINIKAF